MQVFIAKKLGRGSPTPTRSRSTTSTVTIVRVLSKAMLSRVRRRRRPPPVAVFLVLLTLGVMSDRLLLFFEGGGNRRRRSIVTFVSAFEGDEDVAEGGGPGSRARQRQHWNRNRNLAVGDLLKSRINQIRLSPPNLLFLVADQLRFDALGFIQEQMTTEYGSQLKIRTPNIDRLAATGVNFAKTYCAAPSCAPSRVCMKTGNTLQRTGIFHNSFIHGKLYNEISWLQTKVNNLVTYEQVLAEQLNYTVETVRS